MSSFLIGIITEDLIHIIVVQPHVKKDIQTSNKYYNFAWLEHALSETEAGFHHYIDVENDEIIYHSYNNLTETGYYETFVWKIGVGLIQYKSGFGAERESIKLDIVKDY